MKNIRKGCPADRVENTRDDLSEVRPGENPRIPPEPEPISVVQRVPVSSANDPARRSTDIPSDHGHEGIEDESNDQEDLGDTDPEFCLAKPADRVKVQETDGDQTCRDENRRMR
jgi:hypothetical protein